MPLPAVDKRRPSKPEKPCLEHRHLGVGDSKCLQCLGLLNEDLFRQYYCKAAEVFQQYIEEEENNVGLGKLLSRTAKNYFLKPVGSAVASSAVACAWSLLEKSKRPRDGLMHLLRRLRRGRAGGAAERHPPRAEDEAEGQLPTADANNDEANVQPLEEETVEPVESAKPAEPAEDKADSVEAYEGRPFVIYLGDEPPENARLRPPRSKDDRKVLMYVGSDESDDDEEEEEEEFVSAISEEPDESFPSTSLSSSNSGLSLSNSGTHARESSGLHKRRHVASLPRHQDSSEPLAKITHNGDFCDSPHSARSSTSGSTCASGTDVSDTQPDSISDTARRWENMRLTYPSNEHPVTIIDSRSDDSSGQKSSVKGLIWSDSRMQMI